MSTANFTSWAEENGLPTTPQILPLKLYNQNDAGRAEQFVDAHVNGVRYVPAWNRWLLWEGHYWAPDRDEGITRLAIEHSRRLIREAAELAGNAAREIAVKEALAMGDAPRIEKMLKLAKCDERITVRHEELDSDPFLLGLQNGVVELRTGRFREGRREDLITKRGGAIWVEGAQCPRWIEFIREVLVKDEALISYVQKFVGYTLTGDVSAQCFPFLFGSGNNGKSVFTETLQKLMGEYGQRAPASLLIASNNGREPTHELARLQGARLVVGSETEEGTRLAESRVKDLTGGDTLTGRCLYAEAFDFEPCLKLWLFGNHKPAIAGTDEGIWRRVRLIPFVAKIPKERRDEGLTAKLAAELPGILHWAIAGTQRWLSEGLKAPPIVTEASAEYRDDEDTLADFVAECMEHSPNARVASADMFNSYQGWAARSGIRYPLNKRQLAKRLKDRGLELEKSNGTRFWIDVELIS